MKVVVELRVSVHTDKDPSAVADVIHAAIIAGVNGSPDVKIKSAKAPQKPGRKLGWRKTAPAVTEAPVPESL